MSEKKPILCLDFDGVIHGYESGWQGPKVANDPPVPGAMRAILDYMDDFTVAIYSSRSGQVGGIRCMQEYVCKHMRGEYPETVPEKDVRNVVFKLIEWPTSKPPARLTIDDRAMQFDGTFPPIEDIRNFQPWNKTGNPPNAGSDGPEPSNTGPDKEPGPVPTKPELLTTTNTPLNVVTQHAANIARTPEQEMDHRADMQLEKNRVLAGGDVPPPVDATPPPESSPVESDRASTDTPAVKTDTIGFSPAAVQHRGDPDPSE